MEKGRFKIEEIVNHDSIKFEEAYRIIQDRIPFEERSDMLHFIQILEGTFTSKKY